MESEKMDNLHQQQSSLQSAQKGTVGSISTPMRKKKKFRGEPKLYEERKHKGLSKPPQKNKKVHQENKEESSRL